MNYNKIMKKYWWVVLGVILVAFYLVSNVNAQVELHKSLCELQGKHPEVRPITPNWDSVICLNDCVQDAKWTPSAGGSPPCYCGFPDGWTLDGKMITNQLTMGKELTCIQVGAWARVD